MQPRRERIAGLQECCLCRKTKGSEQLADGTGHSGGANGAQGRILEQYKINITELPEYKKTVAPLFAELKKEVPEFAAELENVFRRKNWYMSPEKLAVIASEKLSVAFKTEQMALQNILEVWIDKEKFDNLSPDGQSILLIHEALMGIKISRSLEYQKQLSPEYLNPIERLKRKLEGQNIISIKDTDYEQIDQLNEAYGKPFTATEILNYLQEALQMGRLPTSCIYEVDLSGLRLNIVGLPAKSKKPVKASVQFAKELSISSFDNKGVVQVTLTSTQVSNFATFAMSCD